VIPVFIRRHSRRAITPWSPPASPIPVRPARRQSALPSIPVYFKAAGALLTSHTFHSSTLMRDGKIFIAGDIDILNDGKVTETYDVAAGASLRGPDLLLARSNHVGVLLPNGQVLILAGSAGASGTTDTTEIYDPSSGTVAAGPKLPQASAFQAIAPLPDGRIIVAGGLDPLKFRTVNTVLLYDPAVNSFNSAGVLAYGAGSSSSTLLADGRVLLAGGFDPEIVKPTLIPGSQTYDPSLQQSIRSGNMSICGFGHTATLLPNGTVLVAGGAGPSPPFPGCGYLDTHGPSVTMEIYDPVRGTFTPTGDMTTPRVYHTATLLSNGKVLIVGGGSAFADVGTATAEVYDPQTGVSTPTATMSAPRVGHTATLLPDGRVVIIGGGPTTVEVFQ